jgi:hypothetical protein
LKLQQVRTFGNIQAFNFVAAFLVEILMQTEPELAHMHANCTILGGTIARGLAEDGFTDLALCQSVCVPADRVLRKIRKQAVQIGGLLEGG